MNRWSCIAQVGAAFLVVLILGAATPALAINYTSVATGNWGTATTWSPVGIPGLNDTANITGGFTVTLNGSYSVRDINITGTGTFVISSAYTFQVYGNWNNNGTATLLNGYVYMTGPGNATIGGSAPTSFYRLYISKDAITTTVTMQQNVTVTYTSSSALSVSTGEFITNGYTLDVNTASARVEGGTNGRLRINNGSTANIYRMYQWGLGYVNIDGALTVVNITDYWQMANAGHRCDISNGTINFLGTATNLSLYTNNAGWGWYQTGGTTNFNGGIYFSIATIFDASGTAVIRFLGSNSVTVPVSYYTSSGAYNFNDLRIEKTGGASVTFSVTGGNGPRNTTANVGVTVNAGAVLVLNGPFNPPYGYRFGQVTNNGTVNQNTGPRVYCGGNWSGTGTFIHGGRRVIFDGSSANNLTPQGAFFDLFVNKPSGSLAVGGNLTVEDSLAIIAGTCDFNGYNLTLGTTSFGAGSVHVSGGSLNIEGSSFANTVVAAASSTLPYSFRVGPSATLVASYVDFDYMDAIGIRIDSAIVVGDFANCNFDHGDASGPMIKYEGFENDTISSINFDGTAGYNIEKLGNWGSVVVLAGGGNRWGSAYENDPNGLVDWMEFDVGVSAILAPAGNVGELRSVLPQVEITNYGPKPAVTGVRLFIEDSSNTIVYDQTETGIAVALGATVQHTFTTAWIATPQGPYTVTSHTTLDDMDPSNDTSYGAFTVVPPWPENWNEAKSIPTGPVKDGGFLAINAGNGLVYLAPGNKLLDFYVYEPIGDTFTVLAPIPTGDKPLKKGCDGVTDNDNYLYLTKGNGTTDFWRYDIAGNLWESLPPVPAGVSRKGPKKGTDLAYVTGLDADYVYLLKGNKTEFYRYNVSAAAWDPALTDVPVGLKAKVDEGSFLCWDEASILYFFKSKYNEFWPYDLGTATWGAQLPSMPFIHPMVGKKKKAKDGAAGAWYDGQMYALKGGNTCEFWRYNPADSWTGIDTMPQLGSTGKKKRVKTGGDLVSWGGGVFFATKGNKTLEFWRYMLPSSPFGSRPERSGVMAERVAGPKVSLAIVPNPVVGGLADLRYSLPGVGPARLVVYDVTGRTVEERVLAATRTGAIPLDVRRLAAGVYLVRLEADDLVTTRKLVIQ